MTKKPSASQRTEALERRVRELEAQVYNLAIQVAALVARGVLTYPGIPYGAPPLRWYDATYSGPTLTDSSYGGTS